ncbi:MAG: hypothetical protein HXY44_11940 [Syntrophaceae bacterium]|nr:hypothetical protein [Syntrophaceae bacterium]
MERYISFRHEKLFKDLAKGITTLFKSRKLKKQIAVLYENLEPVKGLNGRDFELWSGILALAQKIDSENPNLNLYDRVLKVAISATEKRDEETFFLDWNSRFLISVANYVKANQHDSNTFIQADLITNHVSDEVKPPFRIRTETIGKLLDRESILIERRVRWFKDKDGSQVHKTGWRLDVERLKKKVSKFQKYIQPKEDPPVNQGFSNSDLAGIFDDEQFKN